MSDNTTDSHKASAWESVVVSRMRPKVKRMVRKISGLNHLNWTHDDAENELLLSAVMACRAWASNNPTEPPDPYVMQAIVRRRYRLWEKIRKAHERAKLEAGPYDTNDVCQDNWHRRPRPGGDGSLQWRHCYSADGTAAVTPLIALEDKAGDNSHKRAVYRLRQKLPPNDFALLQLRTMDYSTREIAEIMDLQKEGKPDHQEVSRKLYRIRKKAAEFLKQVGIYTIEDVEEADPRSIFHDTTQEAVRR